MGETARITKNVDDVEVELLRILHDLKDAGFDTLLVCKTDEIDKCEDREFVKKAITITLK